MSLEILRAVFLSTVQIYALSVAHSPKKVLSGANLTIFLTTRCQLLLKNRQKFRYGAHDCDTPIWKQTTHSRWEKFKNLKFKIKNHHFAICARYFIYINILYFIYLKIYTLKLTPPKNHYPPNLILNFK